MPSFMVELQKPLAKRPQLLLGKQAKGIIAPLEDGVLLQLFFRRSKGATCCRFLLVYERLQRLVDRAKSTEALTPFRSVNGGLGDQLRLAPDQFGGPVAA